MRLPALSCLHPPASSATSTLSLRAPLCLCWLHRKGLRSQQNPLSYALPLEHTSPSTQWTFSNSSSSRPMASSHPQSSPASLLPILTPLPPILHLSYPHALRPSSSSTSLLRNFTHPQSLTYAFPCTFDSSSSLLYLPSVVPLRLPWKHSRALPFTPPPLSLFPLFSPLTGSSFSCSSTCVSHATILASYLLSWTLSSTRISTLSFTLLSAFTAPPPTTLLTSYYTLLEPPASSTQHAFELLRVLGGISSSHVPSAGSTITHAARLASALPRCCPCLLYSCRDGLHPPSSHVTYLAPPSLSSPPCHQLPQQTWASSNAWLCTGLWDFTVIFLALAGKSTGTVIDTLASAFLNHSISPPALMHALKPARPPRPSSLFPPVSLMLSSTYLLAQGRALQRSQESRLLQFL
ncbi:unnamed protein product [Pleuronectes platessa]|uniref:Uncharacterized protein n=1 Tax=Pleuronectes platessa TaxID=8262 RepID=A0A9N7Z8G5_PLEPL|nr:unnamed protein product [Pleuronectes platessa]